LSTNHDLKKNEIKDEKQRDEKPIDEKLNYLESLSKYNFIFE
jgi:hypothetical protein